MINDAKALVHTVDGTAFLVSPGVFQRYVQEHPEIDRLMRQDDLGEWQSVQKHFERLHYHRKRANGRNIWTCEVVGPRRRRQLHGYLLVDPRTIFDEVPPDNPFLKLPGREAVFGGHRGIAPRHYRFPKGGRTFTPADSTRGTSPAMASYRTSVSASSS